jgi:microcystin-dependent protein
MAVRNSNLGGTDWSDGEILYAADLNDTFDAFGYTPVGSITHWLKTYTQKSTGTNDSTSTNKLIDSTATFITDGVTVNKIVYNSTDGTFSYVTSVDSETELTLADDIFTATSKTYYIYATTKLHSGWVECNGQVLNDPDSIYDGSTIPDLNGVGGTQRFLRGSTVSGVIGGEDEHTLTVDEMPSHHHSYTKVDQATAGMYTGSTEYGRTTSTRNTGSTGGDQPHNNLPSYYEVVMIMRVK